MHRCIGHSIRQKRYIINNRAIKRPRYAPTKTIPPLSTNNVFRWFCWPTFCWRGPLYWITGKDIHSCFIRWTWSPILDRSRWLLILNFGLDEVFYWKGEKYNVQFGTTIFGNFNSLWHFEITLVSQKELFRCGENCVALLKLMTIFFNGIIHVNGQKRINFSKLYRRYFFNQVTFTHFVKASFLLTPNSIP